MLSDIHHLYQIAQKPTRQIIGLMSGTSLDGLDVAWCEVNGCGKQAQITLKAFHTAPYDEAFKAEIRRVFAKKEIDFQHLTLLNAIIAERHATIINDCLRTWNCNAEDIDLIASHGQTVFHAPRVLHGMSNYPNATLQIGDGDHIARRTGIITISDFRQKHVAAGGEGAPLALYGDYFLFANAAENRILLNIGGIANFTWLPANDDTDAVFATDTGPGNTLMDTYAQRHFGVPFDKDAQLALAGIPDRGLVDALKSDPFFEAGFPKTIGPELFSPIWVDAALAQLPKGTPAHNPYNIMASLATLTAETVAEAILRATGGLVGAIYVSGGGAHNPFVINYLKELLPKWVIKDIAEIGIPGDAKEAVLFAMLANECVAGTMQAGMVLGGIPLVSMGKISLPN
jgi:anhydro-N-acetylmuramic acid kinase